MLRITVHENDTICRLELAGKLAGPWVAETEDAWRSSLCSGRQIEVDIRDLTAIDEGGRELLSAMHRAGARLHVEGVWMAALVEEITGEQPCGGSTRKSGRKKLPADQGSEIGRESK